MQIQKIFSDHYNNERLYSVLMDENELALFSEAVEEAEEDGARSGKGLKGALIGTGVGAGTVGAAYGLGKGSGWLSNKLNTRRSSSYTKLVNKIKEMENAGADAKKIEKLEKKADKLLSAGRMEKWAKGYNNATNKTQEWIKKNPGKAAAIAAGVAALGAGAGYGVSKLKGKKRDEE